MVDVVFYLRPLAFKKKTFRAHPMRIFSIAQRNIFWDAGKRSRKITTIKTIMTRRLKGGLWDYREATYISTADPLGSWNHDRAEYAAQRQTGTIRPKPRRGGYERRWCISSCGLLGQGGRRDSGRCIKAANKC
jgi:hypothetical protein